MKNPNNNNFEIEQPVIVNVPVIGILSVRIPNGENLDHAKIMETAESIVNELAMKRTSFMGDGFGFRLVGINEFWDGDDSEERQI